jgi:hypothetical protein
LPAWRHECGIETSKRSKVMNTIKITDLIMTRITERVGFVLLAATITWLTFSPFVAVPG